SPFQRRIIDGFAVVQLPTRTKSATASKIVSDARSCVRPVDDFQHLRDPAAVTPLPEVTDAAGSSRLGSTFRCRRRPRLPPIFAVLPQLRTLGGDAASHD